MSHNTRVRADLAAWNVATPVTGAQFDALDAGQYKSINGDDGGVWAPSAAIVIGGSGLELSGSNHELTGILNVDTGEINFGGGSLTGVIAGSPLANGAWTFSNQITVTGSLISGGGTITGTWAGDPTFSGVPTFSGGGTLSGTWGGDPTWTGTHTHSGTITSSSGTLSGTWAGGPTWTGNHLFQGSVTHSGTVSLSGTGKIQERVVSGADSNQTYDADDADMIRVGTLSASRVYTIGSGTSGQKLTITKMYQANNYTITLSGTIDSLGGTLPAIRNQTSGDMNSITLRCYGPGWCIEQQSFVP